MGGLLNITGGLLVACWWLVKYYSLLNITFFHPNYGGQ
jgi:hypothetical protein